MYIQLLKTGEEVAKLQADLEVMQPQLEQAQIETEQTMAKIEKDSGTASTQSSVPEMYVGRAVCLLKHN